MDNTEAATQVLGLIRLDHVGLAVADLEAAIAHYEQLFGMRCLHVEDNPAQGVREAMLSIGPDPAGGCLQLLAPTGPDSPIARFLDKSGPGVQQIACAVEDVDAACEQLRARGARLLYQRAQAGTAGSRINFVHPRDAGGVLLELVEGPR